MLEQIQELLTQDQILKTKLKGVSDLGDAAELIVDSGKGKGYNFTAPNVALELHKMMGANDNSNQLSELDLLSSAGKGIYFNLRCTDPDLPGTCVR